MTTAAERVRSGDPVALVELLSERFATDSSLVALRVKRLGLWKEYSWAAFGEQVRDLAVGLASIGVEPGHAVAVMAASTPESVAIDLAVQTLGAATLPINPDSSMSDVRYLVDRGMANLLVIGDLETVDRVRASQELDRSGITTAIIIEGAASSAVRDWRLLSFEELNARGAASGSKESLADLVAGRTAKETIAIHPTAGTTGLPRLTAITSENVEAAWIEFLKSLHPTGHDSFVVEAPQYHVTGHAPLLLLPLVFGAVAHFSEHSAAVDEAMSEVAPTISIALPDRWESRAADLTARVRESSFIHRWAFNASISVLAKVAGGESAAGYTRVLAAIGRHLVVSPIRKKLGLDRLRAAAVGGRYMSPDLLVLWRCLGVPMVEFYGTTETSGMIAFQATSQASAGTGMRTHSGLSVKINPSGEVTVSGPAMAGAHGHSFVGTGDRGEMSADLLSLGSRLADIVSLGGRDVPVDEVERVLRSQGHIRQVAVVGRGRPYLAALIEIDYSRVSSWARANSVRYGSLGSLADNLQVLGLIESTVNAANRILEDRGLPKVEGFKVLNSNEGFESKDVLGLTGEIRRSEVETLYKHTIDALYSQLAAAGGKAPVTIPG